MRAGDIERNPGPSLNQGTVTSDLSLNFRKYFSIVQYNVQSALRKIDILSCELSHFDVIALTETWFSNNIKSTDVSIPNFQVPFRRDRLRDNYGGVAVYVKDHIPCSRRSDLELPDIECVWIEIHLGNKKILFGTFYRPPNAHNSYFDQIENSISLAIDTGIADIIVTGDFNCNMLYNPSARKIASICRQSNLNQIINESTHFTETSQSLIDLIMVSDCVRVIYSGVGEPFLDQHTRYHCPVFCLLNFQSHNSPAFKRQIWKYEDGDYDTIKHKLHTTNWDLLFTDDPDETARNITDHISSLCSSHIPNKLVTVRHSDPPWFHNEIRKMIRKRKRAYDKAKKTNNPSHWNTYKKLRNETTTLLRQSKKAHAEKLANKLKDNSLKGSDWWKVLKSFISDTSSSNVPPLKSGNAYTKSEKEKAETLNSFFTSQSNLTDDNNTVPHLPQQTHYPPLNDIIITPEEVECILSNLQTGKANGPDNINNYVLKRCSQELSLPLSNLFNQSLQTGIFPVIWKEANVTPIYKKNDPSDPSNYRPISLLSTLGKTMEKVVHKHVFNYLRDYKVLSPLQSGFIPGDSTVNQLVDVYNTFCKAMDDGLEVRAIFCDISKAFDRVWHKGLLAKLYHIGIGGSLLKWFSNYLSDRKQRVVLPKSSSSWGTINAGVPQGSILGPLLFLVYINDITQNIYSNIRLFADDTTLYIIVRDPNMSAALLNQDMQTISTWAETWLVSFNPNKTESLLISRKINRTQHPPVYMQNNVIAEVETHKHLGLTFDHNLTWHSHIEIIVDKAWKRIHVMRKLKYLLDRDSLQTIYFSFIRPLLEYGDVVWDNCTDYEANELEKIQNEAGRIVIGATKLISIDKLHQETGWESLSSRRRNHKLILFYKMVHQLVPPYLCSLVPNLVGNRSRYSLRNVNDFESIRCRTCLFQNSFVPHTVREWNNLSEDIKDSSSLSTFKSKLKRKIEIPKHYREGSRIGQLLLMRLRTNSSTLKNDLFNKNMIESPLCSCGMVEDAFHFIFQCQNYQTQRQIFIAKVSVICVPSLQNILHGNKYLTDNASMNLLNAILEYIQNTKRFTQST